MSKKPVLFRYKNLKIAVFEDGVPDKPCIVIERGYKVKDSERYLNVSLSCFLSDLEQYILLMREVLKKYKKS